jgi:hypothetical protein
VYIFQIYTFIPTSLRLLSNSSILSFSAPSPLHPSFLHQLIVQDLHKFLVWKILNLWINGYIVVYFVLTDKFLCVQKLFKIHCQFMASLALFLRLFTSYFKIVFLLLKLCTETIVTLYILVHYT